MYGQYMGKNLPLQMQQQQMAPQAQGADIGMTMGLGGQMPQQGITSLPPGAQGIAPQKSSPQDSKARDMLVNQLMNPRQVDNSKLDMQALAPLGMAMFEKYRGA